MNYRCLKESILYFPNKLLYFSSLKYSVHSHIHISPDDSYFCGAIHRMNNNKLFHIAFFQTRLQIALEKHKVKTSQVKEPQLILYRKLQNKRMKHESIIRLSYIS